VATWGWENGGWVPATKPQSGERQVGGGKTTGPDQPNWKKGKTKKGNSHCEKPGWGYHGKLASWGCNSKGSSKKAK